MPSHSTSVTGPRGARVTSSSCSSTLRTRETYPASTSTASASSRTPTGGTTSASVRSRAPALGPRRDGPLVGCGDGLRLAPWLRTKRPGSLSPISVLPVASMKLTPRARRSACALSLSQSATTSVGPSGGLDPSFGSEVDRLGAHQDDGVEVRLESGEHVEEDQRASTYSMRSGRRPSRAPWLPSSLQRGGTPPRLVLAHPGQDSVAFGGQRETRPARPWGRPESDV